MEKKKILLVDDEVVFLKFLDSILEATGKYEIMALLNTDNLVNRISKFKPDIILLDIIMPGANGIEVCRALKNDPAVKDIPVVMLSAMDRDEERLKAFKAGAYDFIAKPVKKEDLLNKIELILGSQK